MENKIFEIKVKKNDIEFEIKGDKDFIDFYYHKILDEYKIHDSKITEAIETPKYTNDESIEPLDVFLQKFTLKGLQKKTLATALYLIDIKKIKSFRGRDINSFLRENDYEPLDSISTHIKRLREKGLLSILRKEGNESVITIYKENKEKAYKYISESSD